MQSNLIDTSLLRQGGVIKRIRRLFCRGVFIVMFLPGIILFSCTKIIPAINDEEPHQYVLNSLFTPDRPIEVFISQTIPILEKQIYAQDDEWDIKLYEDSILLPLNPAFTDSSYMIDYSVIPGSQYRIEALNMKNGHLLTAEDVVPQIVELRELANVYPLYTDRHETIFGQLTFKFLDDGGDPNFYEIVVGRVRSNRFKAVHTYKVTHPVITFDSEKDAYPLTLLFTNDVFRGDELAMDIIIEGAGGAIILRKVSYNYFMYKRHLYAHLDNQNRDKDLSEVTDPVMLYSNVENGMGIFASFCKDMKWVDGY
ncbi:MAG: DUF4249 domain-containing protein [Bacteroidales bacterium]|nr:DUF4249 domain-containing protein [Bacteroidales bacterium]